MPVGTISNSGFCLLIEVYGRAIAGEIPGAGGEDEGMGIIETRHAKKD
jgi:hypothetical protein